MAVLDEMVKDVLAYNLYHILKKDESVSKCDDELCDNEDCVVYRALEQYMKYQFKEKNSIKILIEFIVNEGEAEIIGFKIK